MVGVFVCMWFPLFSEELFHLCTDLPVVPVLSIQGHPNSCASAQLSVTISLWSLSCDPFLAVSLVGFAKQFIQTVCPQRPSQLHPHCVTKCIFITSLQPFCCIRIALEVPASV